MFMCKNLCMYVSTKITAYDPEYVPFAGRLGAPIRLQADGSRQSIHIHWSDPFTLDITGTEPDILNYTLYINNLNTNLKLSVNATDSNFTFETGDPDPCHVYLFQVSAWSMLGEGKRSVAVEASFLGG